MYVVLAVVTLLLAYKVPRATYIDWQHSDTVHHEQLDAPPTAEGQVPSACRSLPAGASLFGAPPLWRELTLRRVLFPLHLLFVCTVGFVLDVFVGFWWILFLLLHAERPGQKGQIALQRMLGVLLLLCPLNIGFAAIMVIGKCIIILRRASSPTGSWPEHRTFLLGLLPGQKSSSVWWLLSHTPQLRDSDRAAWLLVVIFGEPPCTDTFYTPAFREVSRWLHGKEAEAYQTSLTVLCAAAHRELQGTLSLLRADCQALPGVAWEQLPLKTGSSRSRGCGLKLTAEEYRAGLIRCAKLGAFESSAGVRWSQIFAPLLMGVVALFEIGFLVLMWVLLLGEAARNEKLAKFVSHLLYESDSIELIFLSIFGVLCFGIFVNDGSFAWFIDHFVVTPDRQPGTFSLRSTAPKTHYKQLMQTSTVFKLLSSPHASKSIMGKLVDEAVDKGSGKSLLHFAAEQGRVPEIKRLIMEFEASATSVDNQGNQPLHVVALCDQAEAVRALLALQAPIDMPNDDGLYPQQLAPKGTTSHRLLTAAMMTWENHTRPLLENPELGYDQRCEQLYEGLSFKALGGSKSMVNEKGEDHEVLWQPVRHLAGIIAAGVRTRAGSAVQKWPKIVKDGTSGDVELVVKTSKQSHLLWLPRAQCFVGDGEYDPARAELFVRNVIKHAFQSMVERTLSDSHKRVVRYCVNELMATGLEVEGLREAAQSAMKLLQKRLHDLAEGLQTLPHFTANKEEVVGRARDDESLLLQTAHGPPIEWLDQHRGVLCSKEGQMVIALLDANAFETVEDVLEWVAKKCARLKNDSGADLTNSAAGLEHLRNALSEEALARYLVGWAGKLNASLQYMARHLFGKAKVKAAPVKKLERVLEKLSAEDKERLGYLAAAEIRDLARFSVECASESELQEFVQRLRDAEWFEPLREKNGFHFEVDEDATHGYRDFKMFGVFHPPASSSMYTDMCDRLGRPVCQIVEVQFLLEEFLQIKKYQHILYTVLRKPEGGKAIPSHRQASDESNWAPESPRTPLSATAETPPTAHVTEPSFANITQRVVVTVPRSVHVASVDSQGAAWPTIWPSAEKRAAAWPGCKLMVDWVTGEVLVTKVAQASAALSAGLRPGQRILSINGNQLKPHAFTDKMVASMLVGAVQDEERGSLELEVLRGGRYSERNVWLESESTMSMRTIRMLGGGEGGRGASTFGLQLSVNETSTSGHVQVGSCVEKSPADKTGELIEGDMVLEINFISLIAGEHTAESAQRKLAEAASGKKGVVLKIRHAVQAGGGALGLGRETRALG